MCAVMTELGCLWQVSCALLLAAVDAELSLQLRNCCCRANLIGLMCSRIGGFI